MSRSPIVGRFLKDGSTEYRAKGFKAAILPGVSASWLYHESEPHGVGCYPTRKAAIERIEQLLCGGVTV